MKTIYNERGRTIGTVDLNGIIRDASGEPSAMVNDRLIHDLGGNWQGFYRNGVYLTKRGFIWGVERGSRHHLSVAERPKRWRGSTNPPQECPPMDKVRQDLEYPPEGTRVPTRGWMFENDGFFHDFFREKEYSVNEKHWNPDERRDSLEADTRIEF